MVLATWLQLLIQFFARSYYQNPSKQTRLTVSSISLPTVFRFLLRDVNFQNLLIKPNIESLGFVNSVEGSVDKSKLLDWGLFTYGVSLLINAFHLPSI